MITERTVASVLLVCEFLVPVLIASAQRQLGKIPIPNMSASAWLGDLEMMHRKHWPLCSSRLRAPEIYIHRVDRIPSSAAVQLLSWLYSLQPG